MKSIVLIHTVKSVTISFDRIPCREIGTDLTVHNLWDDYPANGPNEEGEFTTDNRNRLLPGIKAQKLTGVDLIVTTCSALAPTVETIRPFTKVPVVAVDDAVAGVGVTYGKRVPVTATVGSIVHPTVSKIEREGRMIGKRSSIDTYVCTQAFQALKTMDMKKHDRILMKKAKEFTGHDCITLAQASTAHLEYEIVIVTGCPVLTSPRLCVEEIKQELVSFC